MRFFVFAALITLFQQLGAASGSEIRNPNQIDALSQLQHSLDKLSDSIMQCMNTRTEHVSCLCVYRENILAFNRQAKEIFKQFPSLTSMDLIRFKMNNGAWVSQSLESIRKQAGMVPECPG